MTEAQKVAYAKRQRYLAGERRFVYVLFGVILAVAWIVGSLFGGMAPTSCALAPNEQAAWKANESPRIAQASRPQ
jgi:hypothetical protein